MVKSIEIKNFKSIVHLKMDLGRINVIIGENGCGKTNILEAFAFASAASQDKLDNEYLLSRGIRLPNSKFIKPAFEDIESPRTIEIAVAESLSTVDTKVQFDNSDKRWKDVSTLDSERNVMELMRQKLERMVNANENLSINSKKQLNKKDNEELVKWLESLYEKVISDLIESKNEKFKEGLLDELSKRKSLPTFLIFTPNDVLLREQNREAVIKPFGVHGEGLFSFLKEQMDKEKGLFEKLYHGLQMLDWFDGINIPKEQLSNESRLMIGDRYLKKTLHFFDQRSANEGFLYLLFYLTLFNSKESPYFFAIDNIETSLNPRLCMHLVSYLIKAAKENGKQVIFTTHNPYVLDALDLKDEEQRLFVARRNIDGHTHINRITYKGNRTQKLSTVWMNGYIGGLPDNF